VLAGSGLALASALALALVLPLPRQPDLKVPPPLPVQHLPALEVHPPDHTSATPTSATPAPPVPLPPGTQRPLRTPPVSIANQRLEQIQPLLADKSPTLPRLRQAVDLLLAAYKDNPEHLRLPATHDALLRTLGAQVVAAIEDGDDVRAQALLRQLPRLHATLPPRAVLEAVHTAIHDAISIRMGSTQDAASARRGLDTARLAGLPPEQIASMRARVRVLEPPPGWSSVRVGTYLVHMGNAPVSRAAYAQFAKATGRPATACRESGSLPRRDWSRPGFAQAGSDPVVCISWQDATDYANWISRRDGRRYRLPSMDETASLPVTDTATGRALAEWRSDCSLDCARRMVSGRSWRSRQDQRPLPAGRGYHDVSFRLVIDLPVLSPPAQLSASLSGLTAQSPAADAAVPE